MHVSYGIIPIFKTTTGKKEYLLLQSHDKFWGFPKGHPENNETPQAAAIREAYEETSILVNENDLKPSIVYEYEQPINGIRQTKRIVLFPVFVKSKDVTLQPEEIAHHKWVSFKRAISLIGLPTIIRPLTEVENNIV